MHPWHVWTWIDCKKSLMVGRGTNIQTIVLINAPMTCLTLNWLQNSLMVGRETNIRTMVLITRQDCVVVTHSNLKWEVRNGDKKKMVYSLHSVVESIKDSRGLHAGLAVYVEDSDSEVPGSIPARGWNFCYCVSKGCSRITSFVTRYRGQLL